MRIQGVVGRPMSIPRNANPAQLFLRLGYEDDNYSDNGYWGRSGDDGTGNQCKGLGNAFVIVTVVTGGGAVPPPKAAPLDLVWDAVDDNGIPLNPRWGYQVDHAGAPPDVHALCPKPNQPPCTTQAPSLDTPGILAGVICAIGATTDIHGHVNWMPATYEGPITWESHSNPIADDDYNFRLLTPNGAGLTSSTPKTLGLGLEFDSTETIDHFDTPWWNAFHKAVDKSDKDAQALVNGSYAIVTGLLGLDCEHSCATELHPVYVMAIRVKDDPADETWAIFVRNWGNEGFCSQSQHYLDLFNNTYTLRLPWRSGASAVTVTESLFKTTANARVSGPSVAYGAEQGVVLTFSLPRPEDRGRVNGEVHLRWTEVNARAVVEEASLLRAVRGSAAPAAAEVEDNAEHRIEALLGKMTPAQRTTFQAKLPRKVVAMDTLALPKAAPVALPARRVELAVRRAVPKIRSVPDADKAARDTRNLEVLRTSFGGKIPGYELPAVAPSGTATPGH